MSRRALDWARSLGHVKMKPNSRVVLMLLADNHNTNTGACFPAYETIAKAAGFDRRTAIRAVKELEGLGLLIKHERPRNGRAQSSNQFELRIEQGDNRDTLSKQRQGDKMGADRVTRMTPKHKERGTDAQNCEVIDNDDVF